ncbi:dihydrolipoyl dehydrogenase [Spiroplasma endosymbiont of Labia minor]|uniref:dihydrolipoyl dehydrogenase n=1 Tax=Spiroplasma endosymbiont of Labia minor TaxID=3066305 RepID=UPI0030D35FF8
MISETVNKYDVIIVGAGFGGYTCALKCAKSGLKVALIEKLKIGGVCLNVGCIPTKTFLKSALVYRDFIDRSASFGLDVSGARPKINWLRMLERKQQVIDKLVSGMQFMVKKNNIDYINGDAKTITSKIIEVNEQQYECDNLVIATGSLPIKLNLPGFEDARKANFLINSTQILNLTELPKTLVIIGGGVIGIEFANLFSDLDCEVFVIEGAPNILPNIDNEVRKEMIKILSTRGNLHLINNAKVLAIKDNTVIYQTNDGKEVSLHSDLCLEAIGRHPVINGFENIGLKFNDHKAIIVNENCETNLEHVYAVGDVFGKAMLAHVAQHAGIVVANKIAQNKNISTFKNLDSEKVVIPACIYTYPEISMIGMTEEQLQNEHIEYNSAKFLFTASGKALADDASKGFIKILSDKKTKLILGAHMIGHRVTELISEIGLAMDNNLTIEDIANTIHPHPTISESIGEVAEMLVSRN